jgi:hypothetical protein
MSKPSILKVGDRVEVVGDDEDNSDCYVAGRVGVVESIGSFGSIEVLFDADASGNADYWFVDPKILKLEGSE